MMNRFTPAAAVASKTLTAPVPQVSMCLSSLSRVCKVGLTFMVYSLCARRTTASSTCTPDDYIGTVLLDGCCKVVDIRVLYALHNGFRSECF